MKLTFNPIRSNEQLELAKTGDTLTINGADFDLSGIPEGATLPRKAVDCDWLASDIERTDGVLCLTLMLPHGANAPHETLFPIPIQIGADGPVELPAYGAEEIEE
jgi:hypothetical protein